MLHINYKTKKIINTDLSIVRIRTYSIVS